MLPLDAHLARHCAPALAGIKPSNLVSCQRALFGDFQSQLTAMRAALAPRGICIEVLCTCAKRYLIIVYREQRLAQHLASPAVQSLLCQSGYPLAASLDVYLAQLKKRLDGTDSFPHEIGLFLGYPPEDVAGFCQHGGSSYKYCGQWKVYGDVARAQATFARYDKCRDALCRRVNLGMSLAQIFCA